MKTHKFSVAMTLCVLGAVAVLVLLQSDLIRSERDVAAATLQWTAASAQRYRLETDSVMQMRVDPAAPAQSITVKMSAALHMKTLSTLPAVNGAVVGMLLSDVELAINGQPEHETARLLEVPFRVQFEHGGVPVGFEFPGTVGSEQRKMLENTLRHFQVTINNATVNNTVEQWTSAEQHGSGSYQAHYQRVAPTELAKTKHDFIAAAAAPMLKGARIASREAIALSAKHDWIQAMTVDEALQSDVMGDATLTLHDHFSIELDTAGVALRSDQRWQFTAAAAPAVAAAQHRAPDLTPAEARRQLIAAIAELDALANVSDKSLTATRPGLIHRLRDLLRIDASLPETLLEALRNQSLNDRTRADLYLAMQLAATEAVQTALITIVRDEQWSTGDAMRAMVALGSVANPSPETVAVLWETSERSYTGGNGRQLASTATFALGSIGRKLKSSDAAAYSALRQQLLMSALNNTGTGFDAERRANFVFALGNTHDPSLAGDVSALLQDSSASVRRAAALTLSQLGPDSSADSLLNQFRSERSDRVRSAIMESLVELQQPSSSAMKEIRNAVEKEADENTRYQMARFLAEHIDTFPDNEPVLRNLIRHEPSSRTRQAVAEVLASRKLKSQEG